MIGPGTALVELVALGDRADAAPRAFAVQVGAFQETSRAEELAASLCRAYPDVSVRSDAVWHRVQVGYFPDRDAAESVASELAARRPPAVVVPLPLAESPAL